ncbi:hypothetical protein V6Z88_005821 [Aspergillus fumigatus]
MKGLLEGANDAQSLSFPEENLSTFVHTILITTITSGEQHPNESCAIHHWDHPITALRRSVVIPTGLSIESLSYIEGFRELGRFKQPQSRVSPQETHDYLSLLIRETPVALCPTGDDAESHQVAILRLVRRLEERTKKSTIQPEDTRDVPLDTDREVLLCCARVIGSTADTLFADEDSVWRWEKPTSVYHTPWRKGWAGTIEDAVEGAAWAAGRNCLLRVEGVDRRQKNSMFREDGTSVVIPPKSFGA